MKQKLKLTFDQLEKEMELEGNILSTPLDLMAVTGGSNTNSSIDAYIDYFESIGFTFTQDNDGNYYYNSGSNSSGSYSNGSYEDGSDGLPLYYDQQGYGVMEGVAVSNNPNVISSGCTNGFSYSVTVMSQNDALKLAEDLGDLNDMMDFAQGLAMGYANATVGAVMGAATVFGYQASGVSGSDLYPNPTERTNIIVIQTSGHNGMGSAFTSYRFETPDGRVIGTIRSSF